MLYGPAATGASGRWTKKWANNGDKPCLMVYRPPETGKSPVPVNKRR